MTKNTNLSIYMKVKTNKKKIHEFNLLDPEIQVTKQKLCFKNK